MVWSVWSGRAIQNPRPAGQMSDRAQARPSHSSKAAHRPRVK